MFDPSFAEIRNVCDAIDVALFLLDNPEPSQVIAVIECSKVIGADTTSEAFPFIAD